MNEGALLVLGDEGDARMFRLAGAACVVCRSPGDVSQALGRITVADRTPVALLLVSDVVYGLGRAALDRLDASSAWPIVLVLPPHEECGGV